MTVQAENGEPLSLNISAQLYGLSLSVTGGAVGLRYGGDFLHLLASSRNVFIGECWRKFSQGRSLRDASIHILHPIALLGKKPHPASPIAPQNLAQDATARQFAPTSPIPDWAIKVNKRTYTSVARDVTSSIDLIY